MKILVLFMLFGIVFTSPLDTCIFKSCECLDENQETVKTDLLQNSQPTYVMDITCTDISDGIFPQRLDLPGFSDTKIGYFDLQNIGLGSIPDEAFGELQIQNLELNNNKITILRNNAFKGVTGIESMVISNNELADIEDDVFQQSLSTLGTLKLDNNMLGKMSAEKLGNALRNLEKLVTLSINENSLTEVPDFEGLESIKQLSLAKNQIEHLKHLPKSVTDLNLDGNRIKSIEADTFSNLKTLKYLSLNSNQITSIDANAFANLKELVTLTMTGNYIKHLPEKFIFNLINLDRLDLSNQNQMLNSIPAFAFDRVSNQNYFKMLDLSSNRLNDVSPKAFCSNNISNNYANVLDLGLAYYIESDISVCWFVQLARGFRHPKEIRPKVNFKKNIATDHLGGQLKCSCELEKARQFVNLDGTCAMESGQIVSLNTLSASCDKDLEREEIEKECDAMPEYDCKDSSNQATTKSPAQINEEPKTTKSQKDQKNDQNKVTENKEPENKNDETKNQNGQNLPTKQTILSNSNVLSINKALVLVLSSVLVSFIL